MYLDSQIRQKNRHIPSDYWYALTKKVKENYEVAAEPTGRNSISVN